MNDHNVMIDITDSLPPEAIQAMGQSDRSALPLGILAFLLLAGMGVVCIRWPDVVWELQHRWSVRGGEPTDWYLYSTRILGGVLILMGIVFLIVTIPG